MQITARAPNQVDIDVGARVRALRLLRGLTQSDLGAAVGITFQQIQKYEKGSNRISASKLTGIAHALGVPVSSFFATEDVQPGEEALEPVVTAGAAELLHAYRSISDPARRRALIVVAKAMASGNATTI